VTTSSIHSSQTLAPVAVTASCEKHRRWLRNDQPDAGEHAGAVGLRNELDQISCRRAARACGQAPQYASLTNVSVRVGQVARKDQLSFDDVAVTISLSSARRSARFHAPQQQ